MKRFFSLAIILLISISAFTQKPGWTDYYKRQNMYPEKEFIVGFVSGTNANNEDAAKLKSTYESLAKDKVIQSIQVEIESNNSLNISNINGKSEEEFLSKSVSISKANVNGLNTQSYYDKRRKEVFAIAFVNKKELAYYYRNIIKSSIEDIEQKLTEGRKYVKKENKENALKSFYEAMPLLNNIDEARVLLIALSRKMYADVDGDKINRIKLELINEIDALIKPTDLSLSESAYFVAYGLFLQLGETDALLLLESFTYENTGLNSRLSQKWNQEFSSALVKAGNYEVRELSSESKGQTIVYGNYWEEDNLIKLNASVIQNNKIVAVSKGSIPFSWLEKESIDFVPEQIKKMEALESMKMELISAPPTIKLGMLSTKAIKIELTDDIEGKRKTVHGIPIAIVNLEDNERLCTSKTNEFGYSLCYLPSLQTENSIISLEVSIDLIEYLNIEENSVYLTIAKTQNPVHPLTIDIATAKPTVFIRSKELIEGKAMDIKTLEPSIKELLAEKGYNFVEAEKDADFIVNINANTTTGSEYQGIHFAFLDINLSIFETSSGEEIYKTHIDQIKGGGSDSKKAGKKAYTLGAEKLKESINNSF